jgi:polar amino acid transport system substrate-binding protein
VIWGANHFKAFDEHKNIYKIAVTSRQQLVDMLLKGRIDTFIDREESIKPLLSPQAYQQHLALADYQYNNAEKSYIAISKKSDVKQYRQQLMISLQKLNEAGVIDKIMSKREQFIRN